MADKNVPGVYTARGRIEGEDWPGVAAALNARMAARRVGQQELAHLSGVSVSTLRQVQHGAGRRVQTKTLTAISRALDWPEDHLTAVLMSANQPPTVPGDDNPVLVALQRVEQQLREVTNRLECLESVLAARPATTAHSVDPGTVTAH